jgi:hypothetical protein
MSQLAVRLGATACREGGLALALLVPGGRVPPDESLETQLREALREVGAVRVGVATSRPRESGESVIARARAALATQDVPTR